MKPKVYIETSIPSYLTARPSNDLRAMANQNATIEWWENCRPEFDIYISEFVSYSNSMGFEWSSYLGMRVFSLANSVSHIASYELRPASPFFLNRIPEFVVAELSQGHPEAAARRLTAIKEIPELNVTEEVRQLGRALVVEGPIPEGSEIDAYHIAVSTVNGMDYLLTWNCAHIANAVFRPQVEAICRNHGFEPPIICTPQELMKG